MKKKNKSFYEEKREGLPGGVHACRYRKARASLDGPRGVKVKYMWTRNERKQVTNERKVMGRCHETDGGFSEELV